MKIGLFLLKNKISNDKRTISYSKNILYNDIGEMTKYTVGCMWLFEICDALICLQT